MLLFWKKTTAKGIAASIIVGIISAIGIILTGPSISKQFFRSEGLHGLDSPAIISFTLALVTLVIVSLLTQKDNVTKKAA
jgi:cation/acetate symporter